MIIHFTPDFKNLQSILSSCSFRLSYCGEYFGDNTGKVISRAAHPMVSFSAFSDEELNGKVVTYGGYGVGITKDWASKQGLSPVNYIDENSPAAQGLNALLKARQTGLIPSNLRLPIMQLKCFTKHVKGFNSYLKVANFSFESEREWRFVPSKAQIGGNRISENYSTYKKNKDKYNNRLAKYPLRFSYEDISYVYVKTEAERQNIIQMTGLPEIKVKIKLWSENK